MKLEPDELELKETIGATVALRRLRDQLRMDRALGENLAVAGLELSDATDDMNDAICAVEAALAASGVASMFLAVEKPVVVEKPVGVLAWDGRRLLWNGGKLVNASRAVRKLAAQQLPTMFAKGKRL